MKSERLERIPPALFEEHDEISIGAAVDFLRFGWRIIVGVAALAVIGTVVYLLLAPRDYTASAAFTPQTGSRQSALAGLASQFGIAVAGTDANRSPNFYADLLASREILDPVVDSVYRYQNGRDTVNASLVTILDVSGSTPAIRHERAVTKLRDRIGVNVVQRTGVVSVSVSSRAAQLSYEILEGLLVQLDRFNRQTRQSEALAEEQFTQQRLKAVRGELTDAENALQRFMEENRGFRSSSELSFEQERLQREVALRQAVFTTLSQSLEQAKIEAVRDTPLITMVEAPQVPALPDPRGTVRKLAVSVLAGVAVGTLMALIRYARRPDVDAVENGAALLST